MHGLPRTHQLLCAQRSPRCFSIRHIRAVHVSSRALSTVEGAPRSSCDSRRSKLQGPNQVGWDSGLPTPARFTPPILSTLPQSSAARSYTHSRHLPSKLDTMAAALMSKSFAGASLRSAVPTKGQVRHRLPDFLFSTAATPVRCCNPFMSFTYTLLYYRWFLLACGMRAFAAGPSLTIRLCFL